MKFAIASDHRDFFRKHQAIEFEGFLNQKQITEIAKAIEEALTKRLSQMKTKVKPSTNQLFKEGRDLWRSEPILKKLEMHQLSEIVSNLMECKPLRLGYDQYFPAFIPSLGQAFLSDSYKTLCKQTLSLNAISSLERIVCGVMLCLTDQEKQEDSPIEKEFNIFSEKAGNAVFFHPNLPINFSELEKRKGQSYFLIVYTQAHAVYVMNENDPQPYHLKTFGYRVGDKLVDKHHPIAYP